MPPVAWVRRLKQNRPAFHNQESRAIFLYVVWLLAQLFKNRLCNGLARGGVLPGDEGSVNLYMRGPQRAANKVGPFAAQG